MSMNLHECCTRPCRTTYYQPINIISTRSYHTAVGHTAHAAAAHAHTCPLPTHTSSHRAQSQEESSIIITQHDAMRVPSSQHLFFASLLVVVVLPVLGESDHDQTPSIILGESDHDQTPSSIETTEDLNVDEDTNLEDLTDEQLEEICTSRGFELVRELNSTTGDALMYTHQDYVDAASECLQIEADIEEILTNHPEILDDVKRESERMMRERDMLQEQLNQLQHEGSVETDKEFDSASPWGLRGKVSPDSVSPDAIEEVKTRQQEPSVADSAITSEEESKQPETLFDFREITLEVITQMKSDMTKLVNLIIPKSLRDQVTPSLKSFGLVAKDSALSIYDMMKRYMKVFLNKKSRTKTRNSRTADETPKQEITQTQKAAILSDT